MAKRPKVLVIGAAGFIGRYLLDTLTTNEFEVAALDIAHIEDSGKVDWINGSISDETLIASAALGCDAVFFLASSSLPATANADIAAEISHHVGSTIKTAEICQKLGVRKFIFASSGGTVYGHDKFEPIDEDEVNRPRNAYGVSKISIEMYLSVISMLHDFQTISLRISNPYGKFQKANKGQGFIAAAMRAAVMGEPLTIWGGGDQIRDFIHVKDVAHAFLSAYFYDGPSGSFNVGSARGVSLLNCLRLVENATNRKITLSFSASRSIDVKSSILSNRKAHRLLGWAPSIDLEEGLASTAEWWNGIRDGLR